MKTELSKGASLALQLLRILVGWHFLYDGMWKLLQERGWSCLSYLDSAQGPLAGLFKWMASQGVLVAVGDWAVMLGLVAIGLSLITGVLARLASVFGILLLALFYSAQPPEPFATAVSGADGRFFLLERNALEMLAFAVIIVLPCWRGWVRTFLPGAAVLAVFGVCLGLQYRAGAFKYVEAVTSATVKVHEFTALAALKAPFAEKTALAGVEVSRLALGGDLMAGHAHARDLIWTDEFMRIYHTGGTLERTVRYCTFCGIGAVFAEPSFAPRILAAAKAVGGRPAFFANCAEAKDAAAAKSGGAVGAYTCPELTDALAKKGDVAAIRALFDALKAAGLKAGIGAEDVATVRFCAEQGLKPDYWVLAFHSLDYPAATLPKPCNSIWCRDPKAAADYMRTRPEPWVAIRGLAGGAITPENAYRFARQNGAAVVAIDLLDYRIVETVNAIMKKDGGKAEGKAGKKEASK